MYLNNTISCDVRKATAHPLAPHISHTSSLLLVFVWSTMAGVLHDSSTLASHSTTACERRTCTSNACLYRARAPLLDSQARSMLRFPHESINHKALQTCRQPRALRVRNSHVGHSDLLDPRVLQRLRHVPNHGRARGRAGGYLPLAPSNRSRKIRSSR